MTPERPTSPGTAGESGRAAGARESAEAAELSREAREIFDCALRESSIPAAFDRHLVTDGGSLLSLSAGGSGAASASYNLDRYRAISIVALGKAAVPMLDALLLKLERPGAKPLVRGVCSAPSMPSRPWPGIEYFAGGHPAPNLDSLRAARAALELMRVAGDDTLTIFLVSGGGSSLFEAPLDEGIGLDDTILFHNALVGCGAAIAEINTVRKHFSAVKGGRLAQAAGGASKLSLFVSDVPEGRLDALASGPTLPNSSTLAECRAIVARYGLLERFPPRVRRFFESENLPDTPRVLKGPAESRLLLSNGDLVAAARRNAEARGWVTAIDNGCDDWDYSDAARYLLGRLRQLGRGHRRFCLLSGGEVTVHLTGSPGAGGRNQQFALACALELAGAEKGPENGPDNLDAASPASVAILSAGSDGVDGLSPAAGAIAGAETVARAQALGFDPYAALREFNAYPLFSALGDTVVTGPTGNNLRDLRILLSARPKPSSC